MSVPPVAIHRVPRRVQAGPAAVLLAHVAALAIALARPDGWTIALPLVVASHLALVWGTLRPGSGLFGPVLTRLPTRERVVWLTIDDGPSDDTAAILDLLDAHGARATFFVVGERARARPDLVREIVRRGHDLGNHSDTHPAHRFWALGPRAMRDEIERAQSTLAELGGRPPVWFRAVVGMANPFVAASLRRLGLARVAWSARGFDGSVADPGRVLRRVERQLAPGAIVLAHEGARHGRNVETLGAMLRRFDALGYRCVLPIPADATASTR